MFKQNFHKLALWQCLVHAWLVWCVYLSIHPLSTYLCNVSVGLCVFQFSLTCPIGLIDWLIDWLPDTRMLNYSAVQEIPCHYENRNLITEHPALRQINLFHVPISRLILILPLVRIDCKSGFFPWYFCRIKILYEVIVQSMW